MAVAFTRTEVQRITRPLNQYKSDFLDVAADISRNVTRYVQTHDLPAMLDDLNRLVRRYPGPSIVVAAALGFLVERALFRKR
jgi:hypothetical protein